MEKKPANPNTAYGRKRLREEHAKWRSQASPQEIQEEKSTSILIWLIVVGVCLLIAFLLGGSNGALRWLTH